MKRNIIYKSVFAAGCLCLLGSSLQSCNDYLTVYPTDQITEEQFWQDKTDLDNVRAAAYRKLTESGTTAKILMWGEFRSDNLVLNKMEETSLMHLQNAVLMPTESMFDWSNFYTGINYCNMVIERGERMIQEQTDPSFSDGDWRPIKSEMQALRALYYFYLVRAFRDVPYVSKSVTTDKEAMEARIAATPGVAIIGDLIDSLEVAKNYAATNFGSDNNNKGRFTKRSVRTLLADLYLWRGCMLRNFQAKEGTIVNLTDVNDTINNVIVTADGTTVDKAYTDQLARHCFKEAMDNSKWVLDDMIAEYKKDLEENPFSNALDREKTYPLTRFSQMANFGGTSDVVYSDIFGNKNSFESILEIQFDGSINVNSTLSNYLSYLDNSTLKPNRMVVNSQMSNINSVEAQKGFGKTDVRLLETMLYTPGNTSLFPCIKNVARSIMIEDIKDMGQGYSGVSYRSKSSQDANWPIYRLSDLMLIRAEAIARYYSAETANNADIYEGFDLVNSLFARYNPALNTTDGDELYSARLCGVENGKVDHAATNYYGQNKNAGQLLQLLYRERQREFIGEGKFWFDLVRQAEATNNPTETLQTYMSMTSAVKNRLKQLYSLYNPIYSEELKVNGAGNGSGGQLVQNPVWDRYTKN